MTHLHLVHRFKLIHVVFFAVLAIALQGCGGGGGSWDSTSRAPVNLWTWISGSDTVDQVGIYGVKGTADSTNVPGARDGSISWIDASGDLWLFGGDGVTGTNSTYNDMWRWDGSNWTWVSGSNTVNMGGVYGTIGTPDTLNVPGARAGAVSWLDATGDLWLFGGNGFDSASMTSSRLNDLWRWDGSMWTWVSGSDLEEQSGNYGVIGIPDAANVPGAREGAISWMDASGDFWLFGGSGFDVNGLFNRLNDLWRWDGSMWTWVSGSQTGDPIGIYGVIGTPDMANVPGARTQSTSWVDASGDFWLFGGRGIDSANDVGRLNDMWRWDGSMWTWISGSETVGQSGIYGIKGTPDASNVPGGRNGSISWLDANGDLWLFGGRGLDTTGSSDPLNDLWRWDGSKWTWVSGSDTVSQVGIYGVKGTAVSANVPGARDASIAWIDTSGDLWLFGGKGRDSTGATLGVLNDLWRYQP